MVVIRDVSTGDTHKGKSVGSTVRRVWGRRASFKKQSDTPRYEVLQPAHKNPGVYDVLGVFVVDEH